MASECDLCGLLDAVEAGQHAGFVASLRTGTVVVSPVSQYHRGYSLFVSRTCVPELHDMPERRRVEFLREMSLVTEAMWRAFRPRKLNYELLGNSVAHLHWHLLPRHKGDPLPRIAAWENPAFIDSLRNGPRPTNRQVRSLRRRLLSELREVAGPRLRRTFAERTG